MAEKRWTVTSSWMMTFKPDYLATANFFGKKIGLVDLDFEPKEYPNGEILWCISVTYYRQNAEKFGELLQEFDRISVSEASKTVTESTTNDDEEGYYTDLPF